jgi:hypothetical protein
VAQDIMENVRMEAVDAGGLETKDVAGDEEQKNEVTNREQQHSNPLIVNDSVTTLLLRTSTVQLPLNDETSTRR